MYLPKNAKTHCEQGQGTAVRASYPDTDPFGCEERHTQTLSCRLSCRLLCADESSEQPDGVRRFGFVSDTQFAALWRKMTEKNPFFTTSEFTVSVRVEARLVVRMDA